MITQFSGLFLFIISTNALSNDDNFFLNIKEVIWETKNVDG